MTTKRLKAASRICVSWWLMLLTVALLGTVRQVAGIPWPLAQQTSPHEIFKTYGDWNGDRCYVDTIAGTPPSYETYIAYHTGVDLPADSGTAVLAVFDGYVTAIKPAVGDTGLISIARTLGGNPAWHYGHVMPLPTLAESTAVSYGDTLGYVAKFNNQDLGDHLHFYLEEEAGNLTQSACNPLDSLAPTSSQDVQFVPRYMGTHRYKIDYVKDGMKTVVDTTRTFWDVGKQELLLRNSVDIVSAGVTEVGLLSFELTSRVWSRTWPLNFL